MSCCVLSFVKEYLLFYDVRQDVLQLCYAVMCHTTFYTECVYTQSCIERPWNTTTSAPHHPVRQQHPIQTQCYTYLLGQHEVAFISHDTKARAPIGLTTENKQAPLMMHVEYNIRLPDHDYVKAAGHNLISDVYAGITIPSPVKAILVIEMLWGMQDQHI